MSTSQGTSGAREREREMTTCEGVVHVGPHQSVDEADTLLDTALRCLEVRHLLQQCNRCKQGATLAEGNAHTKTDAHRQTHTDRRTHTEITHTHEALELEELKCCLSLMKVEEQQLTCDNNVCVVVAKKGDKS